jgi:hypothetical protein
MGSSPSSLRFGSVLTVLLLSLVGPPKTALAGGYEESGAMNVWEAFQRPPSPDDWVWVGAAAHDALAGKARLATTREPGALFLDVPFEREGLWVEFDLDAGSECGLVVALAEQDDPYQLGEPGDGLGFRGIPGVGVAFTLAAASQVRLVDGATGAVLDDGASFPLPASAHVRIEWVSPGAMRVRLTAGGSTILDANLQTPPPPPGAWALVGFTATATPPGVVSIDRVEVEGLPRFDVCVAAGNVNARDFLGIEDVLFLDRATSSDVGDLRRQIELPLHEGFQITILPPSSRDTARYVLYGRLGPIGPESVVSLPQQIGPMLFPSPLSRGSDLRTVVVANTIGYEHRLGRGLAAGALPAPFVAWIQPQGFGRAITFALQGVIEDRRALSPLRYSVTNGFTVRVR